MVTQSDHIYTIKRNGISEQTSDKEFKKIIGYKTIIRDMCSKKIKQYIEKWQLWE